MSVDFSLPLPPPCVSPFLPVPSQWPQGLTQPLLQISEDHKPPPTPALHTFYNPTLGAPSHPQGAPGPVEVVLAGLQEEEAMCDSSFQTAALPAGLTARRPHEAAGTRPREASSPGLPQTPLTQSLAALPGACAGAAGWGGGCLAAQGWHPHQFLCGLGRNASYLLSRNQLSSLNNRL